MKKIAVVYHSAHGHTQFIAMKIAEGVANEGSAKVALLKAEDLVAHPGDLVDYDGLILGSPTYLGGVSGTFKNLMDATGGLWKAQHLQGKLAAGFTVSSLPSGDKQSTHHLIQLVLNGFGQLRMTLRKLSAGKLHPPINPLPEFRFEIVRQCQLAPHFLGSQSIAESLQHSAGALSLTATGSSNQFFELRHPTAIAVHQLGKI